MALCDLHKFIDPSNIHPTVDATSINFSSPERRNDSDVEPFDAYGVRRYDGLVYCPRDLSKRRRYVDVHRCRAAYTRESLANEGAH